PSGSTPAAAASSRMFPPCLKPSMLFTPKRGFIPARSLDADVGAGINPAPTLPWFRWAGFAAKFRDRHYNLWVFVEYPPTPSAR
ncbi:MAG: hypothetical protein V2B18_07815, partial [Pseudomonadota bacterium]